MASDNSSSLLSLLRSTVKKVKVLLNYNTYRWHVIASMMGRSSLRSKRLLSFNDRPGLRAACSDFEDDTEADSDQDSGSSRGSLQRTMSYRSDQDYNDIDQRAEMFINNFRRQLQIERQVSLDLRYCRGNSFEGKSP